MNVYTSCYSFFVSLITVLIVTPFVIKLAIKIGAVDKPNARKVHSKLMPRLGGLAIFIGVIAGYFAGGVYNEKVTAISLGAILIVLIGMLDDKYELSAKVKFAGQLLVAALIVASGLKMDFVSIPYIGKFQLGFGVIRLPSFGS